MTDVSVIICTADRVTELRETLAAVARVAVPPGLDCELIVVDNGASGAASDAARSAPAGPLPLRVVRAPARGLSHARNTGLAASRGGILLFTDDDVRPGPDWIAGMCRPLLAGRADAVAGGVCLAPALGRPWMTAAHRKLLASTEDSDAADPASLVGANMAFSRAVLARVPAFDEEIGAGTAYGGGEEGLFSGQLKAAGFRLVSAYATVVEHHPDASRFSRAAFLARIRREGRCMAYFAHHWEHREVRHCGLRYLKNSLRLAALRRRHRADAALREGLPEWEMGIACGISFYRQYLTEHRRPRAYDRHGLIKRQNPRKRGPRRCAS